MVHFGRRLVFVCLVASVLALAIPSTFDPESVGAIPGPANDDFGSAIVVPASGTLFSIVVPRPVGSGNGTAPDANDADTEVGEPTGSIGICPSVNSTLWYQVTRGTASVVVDTLESDAAADTVIRVFTGATVSTQTLIPAGSCRSGKSCDDDGGMPFGRGFRSYMVFCATAGTTYNIQIAKFGNIPPPIGETWRVRIRVGQ